ncbi:hypothetical protein V2H45_04555 [Tumidithrix elongata RA019]|uniref:Uncharacterized protein n=1 Tax=Tumidithrix elongata BACA0141 TaxID=2716417 RepID=A0AAW9Q062_9CYAN|nr:hypothetical protein [Tumidithrix elongata RA019]
MLISSTPIATYFPSDRNFPLAIGNLFPSDRRVSSPEIATYFPSDRSRKIRISVARKSLQRGQIDGCEDSLKAIFYLTCDIVRQIECSGFYRIGSSI